jgi:hypothetical protein
MLDSRPLCIAALASLALAVAPPAPARAAVHAFVEANLGFFHGELASYGAWVEVADYGPAWVPHVRRGWRPYTVGHWVWTEDYGWLWVSDEPFGWAVFHYGRWYPSPRYGWVWIPGYDWAPAWVAFRYGDGYVGWAPLPPAVEWQVGIGFRVGTAEFDRYVDPRAYCFVPDRAFLDPVQRHVLPVERNAVIVRATRNVTDYRAAGDRVVNRGIAVDRAQELTHRAIPRARVVDVDSSAAARHAHAGRNEVPVFRPSVRNSRERAAGGGRAVPPADQRQRQAEARREAAQQSAAARQRESERRQQEKRQAREVRDAQRREAAQQRAAANQREKASREAEKRQAQETRNAQRREAERQRQADRQRQDQARREAAQQRAAANQREKARQEAQRQQAAQRREARATKEKEKEKNPQKPKDKPGDKG